MDAYYISETSPEFGKQHFVYVPMVELAMFGSPEMGVILFHATWNRWAQSDAQIQPAPSVSVDLAVMMRTAFETNDNRALEDKLWPIEMLPRRLKELLEMDAVAVAV